MSDRLKSVMRRRLAPLWVFVKGNKFLFSKNSYLNTSGYIASIRSGRPTACDGSPLPWMNYGIISFIRERLSKNHVLFEYGTGNSTMFWAHHVGHVIAVEHDSRWYEQLRPGLPPNVDLLHRPQHDSAAYVNAIQEFNHQFDVIVVDGQFREECLITAPRKLSANGVVILDDSDRRAWRNGVEHLLSLGFRQLKFRGLKPTGFGEDETSVFYRSDNCLGI